MMHLSDSLRSALLYKNGGFYSDMDAITLKDLRFIHAIFYYSIFLVSNWNNDDKKVVTWLSSIYHLAKFASILYEFPRKWDTFSISYKTVWSKEYHMNEKMVPVSTKQSSVLRTPMVTLVVAYLTQLLKLNDNIGIKNFNYSYFQFRDLTI